MVPLFFFNNMGKITAHIFLIIALLIISATNVYAQEVSEASGTLRSQITTSGFDYRVQNLKNFLEKYNSPLAEYAQEFINYADIYGIDYRLVPAITGVESTFGKQIPYGSFNAYGWANGDYRFSSWQNSIQVVTKTLKSDYIDKGAVTVSQIAKIYAPPSSTWAWRVQYFMNKIDPIPVNFQI
jgi:hypothetical protein